MQIYRQQLTSQVAVAVDADGALVPVLSRTVVFFLNVSAASGTSPTLDVTIEVQDPVSGTWSVLDTFAQKVAVGSERRVFSNLMESNLRASWDIAGTTPLFTFTVSVQGKEGDQD